MDRFELQLAKRLKAQNSYKKAGDLLEKLYSKAKNTQVRAESAFLLAGIIRATKEHSGVPNIQKAAKDRREKLLYFVINYSSSQELAQRAYLLLAKGQDDISAEKFYRSIINEFPKGDYADDALKQLV